MYTLESLATAETNLKHWNDTLLVEGLLLSRKR